MKRKIIYLLVSLFITLYAFAQNNVQGTVLDDQGQPLPGVSVKLKNSNKGSISDDKGNFSLDLTNDELASGSLDFSYIGFQSKNVKINGKNKLGSIQLLVEEAFLDDVVVVAYGSMKRKSFTGSIDVITTRDIEGKYTSSITRALDGTVPGVQSAIASGQPGSSAAIRIRGFNSISASNEPLYVIDGVPQSGLNLAFLNSHNISSISILKDAASSSLYGARGANGVILIQSNRGNTKEGKATIRVSSNFGYNARGINEYDIVTDPKQFYELTWLGIKNYYEYNDNAPAAKKVNPGQSASEDLISLLGGYNNYNVPDNELINPVTGKLNPNASLLYNDNWFDEGYYNGTAQDHVVSISDKTKRGNYYFSIGYTMDEGVIVKTLFERTTARFAIDHNVNDWLKLGFDSTYGASNQNTTSEGGTAYQNIFSWSRNIAPIYPVYVRDPVTGARTGGYDFGNSVVNGHQYNRPYGPSENPIATLSLDDYSNTINLFSGNINAEIKFLKYFKFTTNYSRIHFNTGSVNFQNVTVGNAASVNGRNTLRETQLVNQNINQILQFKHTFKDAHAFDVILGHEAFSFEQEFISGTKEDFLITDNFQFNNSVDITALNSAKNEYKVEGYFSRLNYSYKDRYHFSASLRSDGSSIFHPDYRNGTFWSLGAAYTMSDEPFIKKQEFIDNLKIRVSVGTRGNDQIGNFYAYRDQFSVVNNGGSPAVALTYKGTTDISWEKQFGTNYGIDFSFFKYKIFGSVEYFDNTTTDLLFNRPNPPSTGIASYPDNIGSLNNKGIEFRLESLILRNRKWEIQAYVTGINYENKIISLPDEFKEDGIVAGVFNRSEGRSIYDYYWYKYAGVNPDNGMAQYYYTDNDTGEMMTTEVFSDADKYWLDKSTIPDLSGGFGVKLKYQDFRLSFDFSYRLGGYSYDRNYASLLNHSLSDFANYHQDITKSWTPENRNTNVPILMQNYRDGESGSDRFIIESDYLSLNNITLSYTLKEKLLEKYKIKSLRVYIGSANTFLLSKRKGFDPRLNFSSGRINPYPQLKRFLVGFDITL